MALKIIAQVCSGINLYNYITYMHNIMHVHAYASIGADPRLSIVDGEIYLHFSKLSYVELFADQLFRHTYIFAALELWDVLNECFNALQNICLSVLPAQ